VYRLVLLAFENIQNKMEKAKCKKEIAKKLREQTRMEIKKVKEQDVKYEQKMNQIKKKMAKINQDLKNYKELDPSQERVLAEKCFKQEAK
jgi:septation ring formation regulator EzrA